MLDAIQTGDLTEVWMGGSIVIWSFGELCGAETIRWTRFFNLMCIITQIAIPKENELTRAIIMVDTIKVEGLQAVITSKMTTSLHPQSTPIKHSMVQQEQRYSKMTTIDKYASRFDGMMAQHEEIGMKR